MRYDAFISYARNDGAVARQLAQELAEAGFTTFIDEASLAAGNSFAQELSRAIRDSRFVLVLVSPSYVESRWAQKELQLAMNEELQMPLGAVKVIPILIDDCDVPFLIRDKHVLDLRNRESFRPQVERLIANLKSLREPDGEQPDIRKNELPGQRPERLDSATAAELLSRLSDTVKAFALPSSSKEAPAPSKLEIPRSKTCFVVMPFGGEELDIVYEDFIRPVLENECALTCERGDDLFGSNVIVEDIRSSIDNARLVLADLTGKNANVFYEVGIAHTMDKPVLLLAQSMDDVPFDLRHRRVLIYEYSPRGCKKLELALSQHVNKMVHKEDT